MLAVRFSLIAIGVIAFALVALPLQMLLVIHRFIPLGPELPIWKLFDKGWSLSFWLSQIAQRISLLCAFPEDKLEALEIRRIGEQFEISGESSMVR